MISKNICISDLFLDGTLTFLLFVEVPRPEHRQQQLENIAVVLFSSLFSIPQRFFVLCVCFFSLGPGSVIIGFLDSHHIG